MGFFTIQPTSQTPSNSAKELILAKYRSLGESVQSIEEVQKQFRKFIRDNHESLAPLTHYTQIDERGVYTGSRKVHNPKPGGYEYNVIHPNGKVCVSPANGYRYPKETMNSLLKEERILFGRDEKQVIQIKEYLENFEAKLSSVIQLDSRIASNRLQSLFPKQSKVFPNPKPVELLSEILGFVTCENDIILDSFAGSGTTAHAVLALNQEDGGNRKFILVEMEDYADTLTAERVRRVIQGISNAKDEALKNGLGGSFSFFELGDAIEMQAILEGDKLPAYEDLARYVFYTATGDEFDPAKIDLDRHFIGENKDFEVYLFYQPDLNYLRSTSLDLGKVEALGRPQANSKKRLIFAPMKYLDNDTLMDYRIEYCQLPFEVYKFKE